ncbi:MAG: methylglyoxal synthase [Synechococcus sp.]|nr:methylglyoxal synthase [Synechococcus sp.]
MNKIQILEFLSQSTELSSILNEDEIIGLASHFDLEQIDAKTTIRDEGTPNCSLWLVIEGEVRQSHQGVELKKIKPGEFFGESVFGEEGSCFEKTETTDPTLVARLRLGKFEAFVQENSKAANKLKEHFRSIHNQHLQEELGLSFIDKRRYLALVAHNEMKPSLMQFASNHRDQLSRFHLVATGTTGIKLYQDTGLMLSKKVASGPLGGDQAIGKMISDNNILGMIFFRDPLSAHPHHADIEALGRLCDVYQVPFATNPGGATAILNHLLIDHPEEEIIPNRVLENYRNQQKKVVTST